MWRSIYIYWFHISCCKILPLGIDGKSAIPLLRAITISTLMNNMKQTKLQKAVEEFDKYKLPKEVEAEIQGLIHNYIVALREKLGETIYKQFEAEGIITDIIAFKIESIKIDLAYEIAINNKIRI